MSHDTKANPMCMGGFTAQRPRTLVLARSVLSLYMAQPNSRLTHLKKKEKNLKILTRK